MKNKSGNTNGKPKRDSATRSAGKQAAGNRNKHLLDAERRRTDKPHGRLNKQNPVSPQNRTPNNKRTALSKTRLWNNELENDLIAFAGWWNTVNRKWQHLIIGYTDILLYKKAIKSNRIKTDELK